MSDITPASRLFSLEGKVALITGGECSETGTKSNMANQL